MKTSSSAGVCWPSERAATSADSSASDIAFAAFQQQIQRHPFLADLCRELIEKGKIPLIKKGSTVSVDAQEKAARSLNLLEVNKNLAGHKVRTVVSVREEKRELLIALLAKLPASKTASPAKTPNTSPKKHPYPPLHISMFTTGSSALKRIFGLSELLKAGKFVTQLSISEKSGLNHTEISKFTVTLEEWGYVRSKDSDDGKMLRLTDEGKKFAQYIMKEIGTAQIAKFESS